MFNVLQKYKIAIASLFIMSMIGFSTATYSQANNINSHTHSVINNLQVTDSFELDVNQPNASATLDLYLGNRLLSFELTENVDLYQGDSFDSDLVVAYEGTLSGAEGTWARFVSFNNKIMGAFYDGESLFIVDKFNRVRSSIAPSAMSKLPSTIVNNRISNDTLAVFALKDVDHDGTCGSEAHSFTSETGYQALVTELETSMAGTATKEINIALVADTEFVLENTNSSGDSEAAAVMLNNLNVASGIFETQFAIQITATIVIELDSNVLPDGTSLETSDSEVLVRALRDTNSIPNPGLRHLFTGKDLDGSTVGIAFVGSLCRSSSAGVTQSLNGVTAIILTHELGHNFGARHDSNTTACLAPNGGRYIMFPSVSSNIVAEFSPCSEPNIESSINNSFNSCIVEIASNPPEIVSTPNTEAEVGVAYAYDSDSTVQVDNLGDAIFSLDIAPDGMTIDATGLVSWIPSVQDIGIIPVQIRVENADGQDTQFYEVQVSSDFINIEELGVDSYGRNQDVSGGASINSAFEITLTGNTWKSIPFEYTVTSSTVLEFEFSSDVEAEIHGIGFDNDNEISQETFFNVYGTQAWGLSAYRYTQVGERQFFRIPVGQFYNGSFDRLVLTTDNDKNIANANSTFSNIRVFEDDVVVTPSTSIDFSTQIITSFLPGNQDMTGTVEISGDGAELALSGNKWQRIILENTNISPNTVLEFEFSSNALGEIHGIGFMPGDSLQEARAFQLFGSQNWGIQDFTYTQFGEFQRFVIPVGTYFTQPTDINLIFIMDDDRPIPTGESSFRNVTLRDGSTLTSEKQN